MKAVRPVHNGYAKVTAPRIEAEGVFQSRERDIVAPTLAAGDRVKLLEDRA